MDEREREERLAEAVASLLDAAPGKRMQITNLNKALFYLDLVALRDTGSTLTGADYVALQNGPVVDQYKERLVERLAAIGITRQDDDGMGKPVVLVAPLRSYRFLDDHLREMSSRLAHNIAGRTAVGVSKLSHQNEGWSLAYGRGAGTQINMLIAMQEVADQDPWCDAVESEDVRAAFAAAETEELVLWE